MLDLRKATEKVFDRVHKTGEEIKNDLPNWIERIIQSATWKQAINPSTGQPFESVGQWLVADYPYGPGMGHGRYAITYDEFISLCGNRPNLKDLLVQSRPVGKHGGDRRSESSDATLKPAGGNSRTYIEQRLQQDYPAVWQAYLAGDYKSARAAGIAAGFVKLPPSKGEKLHEAWIKSSSADKRKLIQSLSEKERGQIAKWCS